MFEQNPLGQFIGDACAVADAVKCEDELAKAPQGLVDQFWMFRLLRALFEAVGDSVAKNKSSKKNLVKDHIHSQFEK